MRNALRSIKRRVGGVIKREQLDPATRRYVDFCKRQWPQEGRSAERGTVLISFFGWRALVHVFAFAANHLAQRTGAVVETFSFAGDPSPQQKKVYEAFGARLALTMEDTRPFEARAAAEAAEIFAGLKDKWDLVKLTVEGVLVGDLIYDTYLRHVPASTVDLRDERLLGYIREALLIFYASREYLERRRPMAVFVDHIVYSHVGMMPRLAMAMDIPVFMANYAPELYVHRVDVAAKRENIPHPIRHPFWVYPEWFAALPPETQDAARARGKQTIEERLSGKINNRILPGQSAYAAVSDTRIMADNGRPRILVLLHDFCDAAHGYRYLLFPDFYEWITFLLTEAEKTPFDWYVKPHPNNADRSRGAMNAANHEVVLDLQKKFPRATFLAPSVSNRQLVAEGLASMFTIHGTAGHEFPYLGVPVVNAGDNPHVGYSFNTHPKSLDEYRELIARADRVPARIKHSDIEELAYMYVLFPLRPFRLTRGALRSGRRQHCRGGAGGILRPPHRAHHARAYRSAPKLFRRSLPRHPREQAKLIHPRPRRSLEMRHFSF